MKNAMTYSNKKRAIAIVLAIATIIMMMVSTTVPTYAASTNYLKEAQKKYSVNAARTITVDSVDKLSPALAEAGSKAKANSRYIVYVKPGTYNMTMKLTVPANVILVGESNTNFKMTGKEGVPNRQLFTVAGCVYGGSYDCNKVAWYGLRFEDTSFDNGNNDKVGNGWISKATVKNALRFGIVAQGAKTQFAYVYQCNVSNCEKSGIAANEGAWMAVVNGCTITGCKESGVSLSRSNINIIKNCTIKNNKGHGISTDIDPVGGPGKSTCKINKIMGNTIIGSGVNGIYLDEGCKVRDVISRNVIQKSGNNGITLDAGAQVGSAKVIAVAKNTVTNNAQANLNVHGKKAYANLGKENDFSGGRNCIIVKDGATVVISGNKNIMNNASGIGVGVYNGSTFEIKAGTKHQIQKNKDFGIKVGESPSDKSKATLLNVTFKNNGSWAVKVTKKATLVSYKGCNLSTKVGAANRIYKD